MTSDVSGFLSRNQPPLNQADTKTRFAGANVVVTGGASGIGRATVERFMNDGAANVAILDVNREAGEETVKDVTEHIGGGKAHFYQVDVADSAQVHSAISSFANDHCSGRIDHLVLGAATFHCKSLDGKDADFLNSFKINVLGCVHGVQAAHSFMKPGGAVVIICSVAAYRCQPNRWSYGATKGALHILTKDMAMDFRKEGIRVNSVSPGFIWSPIQLKVSTDGTREGMGTVCGKSAFVGRIGETSEVAAAIAFLCSRDAAFIDGVDLPVDGGYMAMGPEGLGEGTVYAGQDD